MSFDDSPIREQMALYENAVTAMRRYEEAKSVLSDAEVERLRVEAEFLFAAAQEHHQEALGAPKPSRH
ncbi:hypothetical protein I4436_09935 [Pseudomonas qingdaonensis]|jgi:hypothetical protein|uniref:hypothetical protein n=1 Tax=Pseudomonas qingdaonensis TaxID=2056231 RepID=UPI0018CA4C0D|nr:hypothetical protein [Pseudomonas qingdaonensis]MBG8559928.1 hypothetical protein [Pseudomonas qingdaonensis]